jgi:hypothetical protein
MLPFKMTSLSIDEKIWFVTKRAYLHTDSKLFLLTAMTGDGEILSGYKLTNSTHENKYFC